MSLVELLTAAGSTAALFILFVVLRPTRSCSGHCDGCDGGCSTKGGNH